MSIEASDPEFITDSTPPVTVSRFYAYTHLLLVGIASFAVGVTVGRYTKK